MRVLQDVTDCMVTLILVAECVCTQLFVGQSALLVNTAEVPCRDPMHILAYPVTLADASLGRIADHRPTSGISRKKLPKSKRQSPHSQPLMQVTPC